MLKTPITIRNITLANRLVLPPMATARSDNGRVSPQLLDYYRERAEGEAPGLIITEHSYMDLKGKAGPNQVSIAEPSDIAGLKKLVDTIHAAGPAKVFAQINHAGSSTNPSVTAHQPEAPSPVLHPTYKDAVLPLEMRESRIREIVKEFTDAAVRAKSAGYDGVEIHSAHGYLLNQFYSPLTNHRTDGYGGDLDSRLRIHREIIESVRRALGDYPIAVRLGGCDYMEGGSTIEDSVYAAQRFEEWGVDLLDLSGGICRYMIVDGKAPGFFSEMTAAIKAKTSIPVILTGNIRTVQDAEGFLASGAADLIGIGRPLLTDAGWARQFLAQC